MKTINLLIALMLMSVSVMAQERSSAVRINVDDTEETRSYRELGGIGLGIVSFRDLATSPLIYSGTALSMKSAKTKIFANHESRFGFDFILGLAFSSVGQENSSGFIISSDINYSRLYTLHFLTSKGWKSKIGGALSVNFINRINTDLRNNAVGFEFFPTLFGSYKIGKNFSRHLPFRKKKGPRAQHFSIQLDIGLINTNFRNGYAYTTHSPFYNGSSVFENHQFNLLSGFRIRSTLDYILYAETTKNAIKISYNWAGVLSGKDPEQLAISHGLVSFSYLYRIK